MNYYHLEIQATRLALQAAALAEALRKNREHEEPFPDMELELLSLENKLYGLAMDWRCRQAAS